ncbi:MAG: hypothetical protein MJ048_04300 [Acidaminococcaceae bacterium]|nr:hypothetical protein [Acidaminococcaceae bacterium]
MGTIFVYLFPVIVTFSFGEKALNGDMMAMPFFLGMLYMWYWLFRIIYGDITGKRFEVTAELEKKFGWAVNASYFIWKFLLWVVLPAYGLISFALAK